jgi:hypothetical protein
MGSMAGHLWYEHLGMHNARVRFGTVYTAYGENYGWATNLGLLLVVFIYVLMGWKGLHSTHGHHVG